MNTISIHQNFKKYFIYAFLTKVMFFLFFAYLFNKGASKEDNVNFIFTYSKDCASYIAPISPLRNLKTFLFIKRPYGFSFRNNGFLEKSIRMWHFACYYFVLIFFIMNLLFIYLIKNKMTLNILLLCVMHIFLYGFIFRYSENRYLVPIYPYFVILATGNILYLFLNFKLKRLVV